MVRPSQGIDKGLLRSGVALYSEHGCAGLSVRKVAQHAGANPAMFHYHFANKQVFLRAVLQQVYDDMFGQLMASESRAGPATERLRATLTTLALFIREHRAMVARLVVDAVNGEQVVHEFLRANVPRHLGLLMALLEEAQHEGSLRETAPLQGFAFLMGAVAAPVLMASAAEHLQLAPAPWADQLHGQVIGDDAIAERIALALEALARQAPRAIKRTRS